MDAQKNSKVTMEPSLPLQLSKNLPTSLISSKSFPPLTTRKPMEWLNISTERYVEYCNNIAFTIKKNGTVISLLLYSPAEHYRIPPHDIRHSFLTYGREARHAIDTQYEETTEQVLENGLLECIIELIDRLPDNIAQCEEKTTTTTTTIKGTTRR